MAIEGGGDGGAERGVCGGREGGGCARGVWAGGAGVGVRVCEVVEVGVVGVDCEEGEEEEGWEEEAADGGGDGHRWSWSFG